MNRRRHRWRDDGLVAVLLLVALVKPTVAAPFFVIVLCVTGLRRPTWLIGLGYLALTLVASVFQEAGPIALVGDWYGSALTGAAKWSMSGGYANLHTWLGGLGLQGWNLPLSLLALVLLALWTYRHRAGPLAPDGCGGTHGPTLDLPPAVRRPAYPVTDGDPVARRQG